MSQEIHSVILNLNSNYSNNKGSNFSTIVNRQLEIKPHTLVALYKGNVVRKPIVLTSDAKFTLITRGAGFPTEAQKTTFAFSDQGTLVANSLATADDTYADGDIYKDVVVTIRAGKYSKLEFCRQLCARANTAIDAGIRNRTITGYRPSAGYDAKIRFPYRFVYNEDNGQFFLGLKYLVEASINPDSDFSFYYNATTFLDLDTGWNQTNAVTFEGGALDVTTGRGIKGNSRVSSWSRWGLGNSPLRLEGYSTSENPDADANDIAFSEAFIQCPTSNTTATREAVFGLHNTWFADEALAVSTQPETEVIVNSKDTDPAPSIQFGARITINQTGTDQSSFITLYANEQVFSNDFGAYYADETNRNAFNSSANILLAEFDPEDYGVAIEDGIKCRWEVYCKDARNSVFARNLEVNMPKREYYVRFLIQSPYQSGNTCVYDTRDYGRPLSPSVVESGALFQMLEAPSDPTKNLTGGLCPCVFFFNSGMADITISNMRSQNVANLDKYESAGSPAIDWAVFLPTEGYRLEVPTTNENSQQLENILRVTTDNSRVVSKISTWFNGNSFPKNLESSGMTSLGSDLSRYNIELNLPIKAYNNTESVANDIGQQRTIVFNTDPVIEEVSSLSAGLVNKNILPPDIKFLSLNNPNAIKLNDLVVQIRNSKTNALAEEITDAGIELLFKAEVAKKPSDQIDLVL